jgi:hypothetical protein
LSLNYDKWPFNIDEIEVKQKMIIISFLQMRSRAVDSRIKTCEQYHRSSNNYWIQLCERSAIVLEERLAPLTSGYVICCFQELYNDVKSEVIVSGPEVFAFGLQKPKSTSILNPDCDSVRFRIVPNKIKNGNAMQALKNHIVTIPEFWLPSTGGVIISFILLTGSTLGILVTQTSLISLRFAKKWVVRISRYRTARPNWKNGR